MPKINLLSSGQLVTEFDKSVITRGERWTLVPCMYGNGTNLETRWLHCFTEKMAANSGSAFSPCGPQINWRPVRPMDPHVFSSITGPPSSTSLDPSLRYANWSVFGDDVAPPAALQDGGESRNPIDLSYSGNGPDMFGLVSSILEEPDTSESVSDWNSSSSLFPLAWFPESVNPTGKPVKMAPGSNGFSDLIDSFDYYPDGAPRSTEDQLESVYQGLQGLSLVESLLCAVQKDPRSCGYESADFVKKCSLEEEDEEEAAAATLFKMNTFAQKNEMYAFPNSRELEPCLRRGEPLNGGRVRNGADFGAYDYGGRGKERTGTPRDYGKPERFKDAKFRKRDAPGCYPDLITPPAGDTGWGKVLQQKRLSPQWFQDFPSPHPPPNRPAMYCGQQLSKENGFPNAAAQKLGSEPGGLYASRGGYEKPDLKIHLNAANEFPSSPDYVASLQATLQNGDYSSSARQLWSDGILSPTSSSSSTAYGKDKSVALSPTAPSLSEPLPLSNGSSPTHFPLSPGPQAGYYSKASPAHSSRHEGRSEASDGSLGLSSPSFRNPKQSNPVGFFPVDSTIAKEDPYQKFPGGFSSLRGPPHQNIGHSDSNKFHKARNRGDNRRDRKNWAPQNGYGGQFRNQYNYRKKQDQDGGSVSDLVNHSFVPPFPFMVPEFKQSPGVSQFGPHSFSPPSNFSFPPSAFPFSDLIDLFHYDDLGHLNPFVNELLCGDVAAPYFGIPSPFNKYRPMRNRSGPANELHNRLEECYEQWRCCVVLFGRFNSVLIPLQLVLWNFRQLVCRDSSELSLG
ncbi:uncharacterized protein LOC102353567 [Latimeria chalumnae]|uniref:uncharacterized protein LOC102353567 n=1 Tax=Latimeria chalumnae TaxID=7897 RepID=UPI00313DAB71